ncbi:MAG: hypothetical protein COA99_15145 [Moraxellaceae bacterium]|nr:MAG: hypothetical protein COA99_15145 [Moraxellaceae bacterium]
MSGIIRSRLLVRLTNGVWFQLPGIQQAAQNNKVVAKPLLPERSNAKSYWPKITHIEYFQPTQIERPAS